VPVGVALLEQLLRQSVGTRKAPGYQVAHCPLAVTMPSSLSAPAGPCPSPRRAAGPAPALLGFGLGHVGLRSGSGMLLPRPKSETIGEGQGASEAAPEVSTGWPAAPRLSSRSMWQPDGQDTESPPAGYSHWRWHATGTIPGPANRGACPLARTGRCILRPGQGPGARPPNAGLHIGTRRTARRQTRQRESCQWPSRAFWA